MKSCTTSPSSTTRPPPRPRWIRSGPACSRSWPSQDRPAPSATRVGLTRQKANYHLRALERHGLVELVEERRKGNCTERVLQATAASYVISPTALSAVAPDPSRSPDQRSARWLLALAGRLVREVGELIVRIRRRRQAAGDTRHRQRGALRVGEGPGGVRRRAGRAVNGLVARYHDEHAPSGRAHRFVVALHPRPITKAQPLGVTRSS